MLTRSGGSTHISMPNFLETGLSKADILRFFKFSKRPPLPSWIFEITKFYWLFMWRGSRRISMPNFVKIGRLMAEIEIFQIFKNGRCCHLGFLKSLNLFAIWWRTLRRISMPNIVKIGQSLAKILRFFDFSRWRPPPSWIVEVAKFYWLTVFGGPIRITVPNFINIGHSVAEILQFFIFPKWPSPPSWIFEIVKFYWLLGWKGSRRISMPNGVKIGPSVAKILRLFSFSRSWIFKFRNFIGMSLEESEKEVQMIHLQTNTYHLAKK